MTLEQIKLGASLTVVGKDLGPRKDLPARALSVAVPASAISPIPAPITPANVGTAEALFADSENGTYDG